MKAFIFTHPLDYEISYLAVEALKEHAGIKDVVLCIDETHQNPKPGYEFIKTTFPRFGNLNGPKFMEGALDLYLEHADGHDEILKVDSDTLVFDLDWAKRPETLVGFKYEPHRSFYGMAYAIKTKSIPLIKEVLAASEYRFNYPEDIMIRELCEDLGSHVYNYSEPGPYAGWKWTTKWTTFDYRENYSVINVYRPRGFSPDNARKLVHAKMRQLLDAK